MRAEFRIPKVDILIRKTVEQRTTVRMFPRFREKE